MQLFELLIILILSPTALVSVALGICLAICIHWLSPSAPIELKAAAVFICYLVGFAISWGKGERKQGARDRGHPTTHPSRRSYVAQPNPGATVVIILLNGPLGIGKSTLAEALMESLEASVMLDGDQVVALNPTPRDEVGYLHSTLSLLVQHHRANGYRHFIINHLWTTPAQIADLRLRLGEAAPGCDFHCFLLELPLEENLRRIRARQVARASDDEVEFELETVMQERSVLAENGADGSLGERLDASGTPHELVVTIRERLGLP